MNGQHGTTDTTTLETVLAVDSLLKDYFEHRKKYLDEARERAPDHNLIRLLNLERSEVGLHSPFLADLLDPYGSHGQGGLFLRQFIRRIARDKPELSHLPETVSDVPSPGDWRVCRERGHIDISIWGPRADLVLFIENKIGAAEQENQLVRYGCLLDKEKEKYQHRLLLFLAPAGYGKPRTGVPHIRLTYERDIRCWLESLLDKDRDDHVRAERVRVNLQQYLEVITRLGGETYDELP